MQDQSPMMKTSLHLFIQGIKRFNRKKYNTMKKYIRTQNIISSHRPIFFCQDPQKTTTNKRIVCKIFENQFNYQVHHHIMQSTKALKKVDQLRPYVNNIVQIRQIIKVEFGNTPDNTITQYLTIQQDHGFDFSHYLKILDTPLQPKQIFSYIYQITRGHALLNSIGIIHFDIKSSNLIILNHTAKDSSQRVIKIIDFDISRSKDNIQQNGKNSTTLEYMAHEKGLAFSYSSDVSNYEAKADTWSLGIVFIKILLSGYNQGKALSKFRDTCLVQYKNKLSYQRIVAEGKKQFEIVHEEQQQIFKELRFLIFECMMQVDYTKRIDILSVLRFLKLYSVGHFNSNAKLLEFYDEEIERCEQRKEFVNKSILLTEREYQYLSAPVQIDRIFHSELV